MAMKYKGRVATTVSATPAQLNFGDNRVPMTLKNTGSSIIYFRYDPDSATATLAGASAAVIQATGGAPLAGGEAVLVEGDVPYIDVACITAETATLELIPGALIDSTSITATIGAVTVAAIGTTADVPLAGETAESATVRTGISLWKRFVNKLIDIKALLGKGTGIMTASHSVTIATDDTVIGATDDTEAAAGGVGSISSKLRKISTDIGHIDQDTSKLQTAAGGGYVRQDSTSTIAKETGGNLAALLAGASPAASTGLASVITTDAEWTSITLTTGALFADVTLIGDKAYMVAKTATPGDTDTGCVYSANIVYRIPTRGRTKIWIRRYAGTNVRIHVTDYQ